MGQINCFYRVRLTAVHQAGKTIHYHYCATQMAAEEKIKFFLKKNEDVAARLGHVPEYYIDVNPEWDIVDHIPMGD